MQALNLQTVNPQQETEVSTKKISSSKNENRGTAFKDMVESVSKEKQNEPVSLKTSVASEISEKETPLVQQESGSIEIPAFFSFIPMTPEDDVFQQSGQKITEISFSTGDKQKEGIVTDGSETISAAAFSDVNVLDSLQNNHAENIAVETIIENSSFPSQSSEENIAFSEVVLTDPAADIDRIAVAPEMAVQTAENISDMKGSGDDSGKRMNDSSFKLEISDSEKKNFKDVPSLFENLFTVTDERSVEQKIADFKSEISHGAERNDNSLDFTLSLTETAKQNILSKDSQSAGATGSVFQQMLSQQIQVNAPDFVRAGSIVLHDNDSGSINMILKPENLGNVKINLHLSDNVITGQITVNSKEAFEAFRQNMETLRQAFQNSGFDNASLSLSYADTSSGSFAQGEQKQSSEQFFSNKVYGNYTASAEISGAASPEVSYSADNDRRVNVVA